MARIWQANDCAPRAPGPAHGGGPAHGCGPALLQAQAPVEIDTAAREEVVLHDEQGGVGNLRWIA